MPDRVLVLAPEDFGIGFKLTGIEVGVCASGQEAKRCLEKEILEQGHNMVFIDECFLSSFDARFSKKIRDCAKPLIMSIPLKRDFKEEISTRDYFQKMVQSAIGYDIRIR